MAQDLEAVKVVGHAHVLEKCIREVSQNQTVYGRLSERWHVLRKLQFRGNPLEDLVNGPALRIPGKTLFVHGLSCVNQRYNGRLRRFATRRS